MIPSTIKKQHLRAQHEKTTITTLSYFFTFIVDSRFSILYEYSDRFSNQTFLTGKQILLGNKW